MKDLLVCRRKNILELFKKMGARFQLGIDLALGFVPAKGMFQDVTEVVLIHCTTLCAGWKKTPVPENQGLLQLKAYQKFELRHCVCSEFTKSRLLA
jgi:hypothetical protein